MICILKLPTGTYHSTFFEERPLPGPVASVSDTKLVRLKSKMHHTQGSPTLEGAKEHLAQLRERIKVEDRNVLADAAVEVDDPVDVWMIENWTTGEKSLADIIAGRFRIVLLLEAA